MSTSNVQQNIIHFYKFKRKDILYGLYNLASESTDVEGLETYFFRFGYNRLLNAETSYCNLSPYEQKLVLSNLCYELQYVNVDKILELIEVGYLEGLADDDYFCSYYCIATLK